MNARLKQTAGFTIVETLIFLAISALMFVLAVSTMAGKQQTTEFSTAVDTFQSKFNQVLSDVSNGNYPELNQNISCNERGTYPPAITTLRSSSTPNGSCTIVGEIIAFTNTTVGSQPSYSVFPVFGRNYNSSTLPGSSSQLATTISEAQPYISSSFTQNVAMPFGLTIYNKGIMANGNHYGAFGIFSFTSFDGSSTTGSGASHVELFPIPITNVNDSENKIVNIVDYGTLSPSSSAGYQGLEDCLGNNVAIGGTCNVIGLGRSSADLAPINPSSGITFCLNSGTDSQSALFTVGGVNSSSISTYKVYSNLGC